MRWVCNIAISEVVIQGFPLLLQTRQQVIPDVTGCLLSSAYAVQILTRLLSESVHGVFAIQQFL